MIRVGLVYPNDPFGSKVGGPETFLKGFVRYAPGDFEIRYVGITADAAARPVGKWTRLEIGGRPFDFYPVFPEADENRKTPMPVALRFTWAVMRQKPDLDGSVLFFDRIEPAAAFKSRREPKIVVIHNDLTRQLQSRNSEFFWSRAPQAYFAFERWILPCFDWVYSVNERTIELYRSRYDFVRGRLSFLPTWADPEMFTPAPRQERPRLKRALADAGGPPADRKWILFAGRFQAQKAPLRLFEVLAELRRRNVSVRLVLIGEGNLRGEMERRARELGPDSAVHFMGQVPQEKLLEYYRASDALILTSHFEGMPRCVVEALACGLPAATTEAGEVRRLVFGGRNGEIVEPYSPEAMAEALERILARPENYPAEECLRAVEPFRPLKILAPVYDKIRGLARQGGGGCLK